ncbi:MAG: Glucose,6-bisphosphate synthase [Acidimicrobiaceae bacterium]|nr:Glucose,6-bisphosphate synthase [Acidimicrobiaceae bacterium]
MTSPNADSANADSDEAPAAVGPVPTALRARVEEWIAADPDPATRDELVELLAAGDTAGLEERFALPLTFGTAGIRGALGAGPARMNRLVVQRTTVGLARFVLDQGPAAASAGIVVGRDGRHGSEPFAADVAAIASRAGVRTRSLPRPLPTPITAFAVRHYGASAGVMVTASHNPAADNGYKVYLAGGAQVIAPHDATIAAAAADPATVPPSPGSGAPAEELDEVEVLDAYRAAALRLVDPRANRALRIVYTPLHGMGGAVLPDLLERAGFAPPFPVPAQAMPDPDFPTLAFPNPEEPGALDLAIAEAVSHQADVVVANDPDADRLAVAVPDRSGGGWRTLSGDELGILLAEHLISSSTGDDRLVATTIVSSSMLAALAAEQGVAYVETLTGFKWLARAAVRRPGRRLVFAYEEALGYAVSEAVADKDGMSAALVLADLAARAKADGTSLLDRLDDLAARLGVHATAQWSLRLDGPDASRQIAAIVDRWRVDPPGSLAGLAVDEHLDLATGSAELPPTDAIVVRAGGRARVVVRPSGTEPKLKCYLEVTTPPPGAGGLAAARREAGLLLDALRRDVVRRCGQG